MPEYNDPVARDAIRQLVAGNRHLQRQIDLLTSSKGGVVLDRGDYTADPAPVEGQVMVDYATDKPYHYARGEWHPFGGEAVLPYPPVYPQMAMTSNKLQHRFWPGGWIVVPAYAYAVDGSVENGFNDSAYANAGLRHDQSSADFAGAAVTCSFTPADIGLPTGPDAPYYGVHVGMRVNAAGTNIGVRMSPKGWSPHSSDQGYGQYVMGTGIVKDYFGLFRLTYTQSPGFPITGYFRQFEDDDVIEIKLYRTGGSGSVDIDNIYFYPSINADAPEGNPTSLATQPSHVLNLSGVSTLSATAQYAGFGGAPDEEYCDTGGGGSNYQDTQIRRGWRDPDLEWSGACGLTEGFSAWAAAFQDDDDYLVFHPRHVYCAARIRGAGDVLFGHQTDIGGFVALGHDSRVIGQAHVYSDHWGFQYLGCHPHMVSAEGEIQVALWMPNQDDDFPTGFPACSTGDNADFEAMVGGDVWFSSSMYDWLHYRTGRYAYTADPSP